MCKYYFSSVWVAEWPPFRKELPLGLPYVLFVIKILVLFSFGSEGDIWVLIAPVPGHCWLLVLVIGSLFVNRVTVY